MVIKELDTSGVNWIDMAVAREQWLIVVGKVMTNGAYDNPCRLRDTGKTRGSVVPLTESIFNLS